MSSSASACQVPAAVSLFSLRFSSPRSPGFLLEIPALYVIRDQFLFKFFRIPFCSGFRFVLTFFPSFFLMIYCSRQSSLGENHHQINRRATVRRLFSTLATAYIHALRSRSLSYYSSPLCVCSPCGFSPFHQVVELLGRVEFEEWNYCCKR